MATTPTRQLSAEERASATPAGLAKLTVPKWDLMPVTSLINRVFLLAALASLRPNDQKLDPYRRVVLSLPPRTGKALEVATPIPTPIGWRQIGDLNPGDWVFDGNGRPTAVVATSQIWRDRPLYKVAEARTGASLFADAEHEWIGRWNRTRPELRTGTTDELWRRAQTWQRPALWIPKHGGLNTPPLPLPIDPYLLGYWLGDGVSAHAALAVGICDVEWVTSELDRLGVPWNLLGNGGRTDSRVIGLRGGTQAWLRHLGVLGDKHIPSLYLRSGLGQRWALLQGLIDSDGHVDPGGTISVDWANERLARDAQELLASLGISANLHHGRSQSQHRWGFHRWRTSFIAPGAARMPRKVERLRSQQTDVARYITAEPEGRGDTVCIQVASPDHTFLAGSAMLPTHNSEICSVNGPAWYLGHNPDNVVGLVSYGATFAEGFGALARNALKNLGAAVFGITTDPSSEAKDWWGTYDYRLGMVKRGGMRAVGIDGQLIGKGFNLMVIDDPVKNAVDALSPTVRQQHKDFWQSTAKNRLEPGGACLIVMQRWHEDDLAGYVMREEGLYIDVGRDGWTPIVVPLRAEPITEAHVPGLGQRTLPDPLGRPEGELLKTRFTEVELEGREKTTPEFWWNCTPAETPILMADWTTKPISEVKVGDFVIGFETGTKDHRARLRVSRVLDVAALSGRVCDIEMASGRIIRSTADHRWYVRFRGGQDAARDPYLPPRVGRTLQLVERGGWFGRETDVIASITPGECEEPVYGLTTETGNYVAWGYASSNSQYQQRPAVSQGTLFRREAIRYFDVLPDYFRLHKTGQSWLVPRGEVMVFVTTDLAASMKTSADYFVLGVWAVTRQRDLLLLNVIRGRYEGPDQDAIIEGAFRMHSPRPAFIAIEATAYQLTMVQRMRRRGLPVRAVQADRDKYSRAVVASTRFDAEGIFLPSTNPPWVKDYITEHLNFPNAPHDDMVDMTAYAAISIEPRGGMGTSNIRVIGG